MTTPLPSPHFAYAALTSQVSGQGEFRLFPAGEFRARDGRPKDAPAWRVDAAVAERLIAALSDQQVDMVIDYEHQTLLSEQNGQPAPAAGWVAAGAGCGLEWREGDGVYVVAAKWTPRAQEHISQDEYRYISPVFEYDKRTGAVTRLLHIALTNNPGLDEQAGVQAALAALRLVSTFTAQESPPMEKLLEQVRYMLNLPLMVTADEAAVELQKLVDRLKAGAGQAATGFDLVAYLADQETQVAALKAASQAAPDPTQWVALSVHQGARAELETARTELVALKAERLGEQVSAVVESAISGSEPKLLPYQREWAMGYGRTDLAALKQFIATAPVVGPNGRQAGRAAPAGADLDDPGALARAALAYQAEQAALGVTVTTVAAVSHVARAGGGK